MTAVPESEESIELGTKIGIDEVFQDLQLHLLRQFAQQPPIGLLLKELRLMIVPPIFEIVVNPFLERERQVMVLIISVAKSLQKLLKSAVVFKAF